MPSPPRILVTSHYDADVVAAPLRHLAQWAQIVDARRGRCLTREEVMHAVPNVHAVIASDEPYDAEVLDGAPHLAVIARDGTGYDAIDLEGASARGILVTRAPVLHEATANTTLGMMIALVRRIPMADRDVREGRWYDRDRWLAPDLTGMTLGLVGFGRVGRAVAVRARAFGMHVVTWNRSDVSAAAAAVGAEVVALDDLLAGADIVSLHLRHTAATDRMCNTRFFGAMKHGAWFINTARGGLVDEAALHHALATGRLAGAALDVFAAEPAPPDHPLLSFDNVLCTPHFAGDTTTTMAAAIDTAVNELRDCFDGRKPGHLVNESTWGHAKVREWGRGL